VVEWDGLETVAHTVYNWNMRHTQRKGDTAVAQAIATFTKMGYDVLIPLTESAAYDLVIDVEGKLKRVQVRFTSTNEVDLRRIHSNSTGYIIKKTKENSYDWLYILSSDGEEYLIEECLYGRRSIKPSTNFSLKNIKSVGKK
jgi:hypothetical protein